MLTDIFFSVFNINGQICCGQYHIFYSRCLYPAVSIQTCTGSGDAMEEGLYVVDNSVAELACVFLTWPSGNPVNTFEFFKHLKGNVLQRLKNDGYKNHL